MARTITDPDAAASLARVIASDLSIYNEAALARGLRDGQPFADLEDQLAEARILFLERVSPELDPAPLLLRGLVQFFERWAAERDLPSAGLSTALAAHIAPGASEPLALVARAGLQPGGVIPLVDGTIVVGRAAAANLQIDSDSLDDRHATLTIASGRVHVEDLGSAVGTFVNGARITTATPLAAGDVLQLGTVVFEVARA